MPVLESYCHYVCEKKPVHLNYRHRLVLPRAVHQSEPAASSVSRSSQQLLTFCPVSPWGRQSIPQNPGRNDRHQTVLFILQASSSIPLCSLKCSLLAEPTPRCAPCMYPVQYTVATRAQGWPLLTNPSSSITSFHTVLCGQMGC